MDEVVFGNVNVAIVIVAMIQRVIAFSTALDEDATTRGHKSDLEVTLQDEVSMHN